MKHLTTEELEAGLDRIRQSPTDAGMLEMIVRRPETGCREVLEVGELDSIEGLVGDNWKTRGNARRADGSPRPETQLTLINSRLIALVAHEKERWGLAGDQLYVDLDLSAGNLPAGTRLAIGSAVIEVSDEPHTGCKQFVERFGLDAMKFVNSPVGKELCMRGIYAKVVRPGRAIVGDLIRKL